MFTKKVVALLVIGALLFGAAPAFAKSNAAKVAEVIGPVGNAVEVVTIMADGDVTADEVADFVAGVAADAVLITVCGPVVGVFLGVFLGLLF